jgi:hypothetical protein
MARSCIPAFAVGGGRSAERSARRRGFALATAACLAIPALLSAQGSPEVRLAAFSIPVRMDTLQIAWQELPASAAATSLALQDAYAELGIVVYSEASAPGLLGATQIRAPREIDGQRLSLFFNCGQRPVGENADNMRVTMATVTFVLPVSEGVSRVGTSMIAQALDMGGSNTPPMMCGSTGLLEARVVERARARIAAAR